MVEKMIIMVHLCTIAMFCTKSVISVKIKDCISAEEGAISTKAFEHHFLFGQMHRKFSQIEKNESVT